MPAFGFFSLLFLLFYLDQKTKSKTVMPLTAAFILIFISVCVFYAVPYYEKLQVFSQDIRNLNERVNAQYSQCTIIPSTTGDMNFFLSQEEGLLRANATVAKTESEDLFSLYPHSYYFYSEEFTNPDPLTESYGIWNAKQRVFADDILTACPCAVFIKYKSDFSFYPYQGHLVDQSKYLNAFLMIGSTEKEANELFSQTLDSYKKGNYQQALILGLKSRQLNYEPRRQLEYILMMIYQDLLRSKGQPILS
jgi:hypothetical protein